VVEWLFGTFAEAGIQMPAQFDIAGIFDLVMQVLGLTWDRLREKVVDLIGEENTQRLEFVAGYIEALITGGLAGLWEQVQQDLSNLWDMVIGGIQDWLIENVVQAAILKIATMWNPVGAIIQLIQTAWNTYQWLAENAQRIFGLVQAVVDSIANIVAGDISGAANWIEQSLADLVPIAISLFANLLGLGGLADHIRTVIEDVQQAVDEAIDALIARVMAMFRGDSGEDEEEGEEEAPEVPTSLVEPTIPELDQLSPEVSVEIDQAQPGIIYRAGNTDPATVTENLLATHPDAYFDESTAQLTLPPIQPRALGQAQTRFALGELLAQQTGVSTVELQRPDEENVEFVGSINPNAIVARKRSENPFEDAKQFYVGDNVVFGIDDITMAGTVIQGLTTTIGTDAAEAGTYLQEWVQDGNVRKITSPHPPTEVYVFTPAPAADEMLAPKKHQNYNDWTAACGASDQTDLYWDLVIIGIRDEKTENFDTVATSMWGDAEVPEGQGALWSGGTDLGAYAQRVRELRPLGSMDFDPMLQLLDTFFTWPAQRPLWGAFSRLFASNLSGKVHVFMREFRIDSVLVEIELPAIEARLNTPGGVAIVVYHAIDLGSPCAELDADGNPMPGGEVCELDKATAISALAVARERNMPLILATKRLETKEPST
jgi:hypothetical protein